MLFLILIQAAATAPADIQLDARVTAREVRIRQRGEASLALRGGPGTDVRVVKPQANGRQRLRNVTVEVHAEARIADPAQNPPPPETTSPN
jgi:hypothetical protein